MTTANIVACTVEKMASTLPAGMRFFESSDHRVILPNSLIAAPSASYLVTLIDEGPEGEFRDFGLHCYTVEIDQCKITVMHPSDVCALFREKIMGAIKALLLKRPIQIAESEWVGAA